MVNQASGAALLVVAVDPPLNLTTPRNFSMPNNALVAALFLLFCLATVYGCSDREVPVATAPDHARASIAGPGGAY
tara:strand:+ start:15812 stop:16039 length:228 start_codon:yes stop_codon:yes gene_type:complete